MDHHYHGHRTHKKGLGALSPKKLGASSYLLELVPPPEQAPVESTRQHLEGSFISDGRRSRLNRGRRRPNDFFDSSSSSSRSDRLIFAESPVAPGVPIVYRPAEERAMNPDRLDLDRSNLTVCPILEGEERLRLLNLQHNAITRMQHLSALRRLVFLDLYDNTISEISGLDGLVSLRVLMLGRNRIARIDGLGNVMKLDVLDLHGNMEGELRVAVLVAQEEDEREEAMRRRTLLKDHKEVVIKSISQAWLRKHTPPQDIDNSDSPPTSQQLPPSPPSSPFPLPPYPQLPSFLVDSCEGALHLYSSGALDAVRSSPAHHHYQAQLQTTQNAAVVLSVHVHYVDHQELDLWLGRVAKQWPQVKLLELHCNDLASLQNLNVLRQAANWTALRELAISPDGNPITEHPHFHSYAISCLKRLPALEKINDRLVTGEDREVASRHFGALEQLHATHTERMAGCSQDEVHVSRTTCSKTICNDLLSSALSTHEKTQHFEALWPSLLESLVAETLQEYDSLDQVMESTLANI